MNFFKNIPDYDGGRTVPCIYNTGCGIDNDLENDSAINNYTLLVTDTDAEEYADYIKKLTENGYTVIFENRIENDLYTALDGARLLYVYYTDAKKEVRIIADNASSRIDKFGYEIKEPQCAVNVTQYGLYYDPENGHSPTTTNCGMFYAVRLADNSLFLIDGGDVFQCSEAALEGRMDYLHRLTGTAKGEKMTVAAWFITHAHNDHMDGCAKMLNRFHDELKVERFVFNFPCSKVRRPDDRFDVFMGMVKKYCPDALYLKAHAGQKFTLGGVGFTVLYAYEDAIRAGNPSAYPLGDYNCTSTVIKMNVGENSVLWMGDTNVETEKILAEKFSAAVFKSDVVQVAHHCFNYLSTLYPMIDADYAMLPNSYYAAHTAENAPKLQDVLDRLPDERNIWYEDKTDSFEFIDGKYTLVAEEELIGGEYDGSGF